MADKPETKQSPTPAERRIEEIQADIADRQTELAEAQGELRAIVTRDIPKMVVEVLPNVHVQHEGKNYHGAEYGVRLDSEGKPSKDRLLHGEDNGTELTLDGPTAMMLVMDGKVKIVRST